MDEKQNILVAGAGKIGTILASLLANSGKYVVYLADINTQPAEKKLQHLDNIHFLKCDVLNHDDTTQVFKKNNITAVVSSLPFYCNIPIAKLAKAFNCHYFDLTEDVDTAIAIDILAKDAESAFVPQCGVAPGFINIVANNLIQQFDHVTELKLRCGALPRESSNALQYALTWSTDGLINEYDNPCIVLKDKQVCNVPALSELEALQIDGANYEAFNTSGGVGSLAETYAGKINTLNYKTIRYPGHCEKMRFLMQDLKLKNDRKTLIALLENALPYTNDDVVIVYVSTQGEKDNQSIRKSYSHKFYPTKLAGIECSAIQAVTTSSACAVIDTVLSAPQHYQGRIKQEDFTLTEIAMSVFSNYLNIEEKK